MTQSCFVLWLGAGLLGCGSEARRTPDGGDADTATDAAPDGAQDAGDEPDVDAGEPRGCADLYEEDLLPTFEVDIIDEEWAEMVDEYTNWADREAAGLPVKSYHPVRFRYGDEVRNDAMIRLKGNPCCSWFGEKMQFVISFNEVDAEARFHGLRKLSLDAPPYDPTLLRDRVALSYLRDLGLPAACANHARLVVNGSYYGVYTHIEHVDREFLERNFDDPDGNLYKYGWELRTNEDDADTRDIERFWSTYEVPVLETFVDLGQAVSEWAAEAIIPHGDGYWAGSGNFYLYNQPGRGFVFIPWDLDLSFEFVPLEADPLTYTADWGQKPDHFLVVLADPAWRARYLDGLERALELYDPATLAERVQRWSEQIAGSIEEDVRKPFTNEEHDWAVEELGLFFSLRHQVVTNWLGCMAGDGDDLDGDGIRWCEDCDDDNPQIHPGVAETCNGIDDDCNGSVDDSMDCPDCTRIEAAGAAFALCTRPRTWDLSLAQCDAEGGTLAVPLTEDEQAALFDAVSEALEDNWWLGVNDRLREGTWTDPDGNAVGYQAWGPDRPNGAEDQNCVVMDLGMEGRWNDKDCAEEHPAVCRLP